MKYTVEIRWITGVGDCCYIYDERGEEAGCVYHVPCGHEPLEESIRWFCTYYKKCRIKSKYSKWKKNRKSFGLKNGVMVFRSKKSRRWCRTTRKLKRRKHLSDLAKKLKSRPLKIRRREILHQKPLSLTINYQAITDNAYDGEKFGRNFIMDEIAMWDMGCLLPYTRPKIKTRIRRPKRGRHSKIESKKWQKIVFAHKNNFPIGLAEGEVLYDHNKRFR